jgi:hypothetical protein
VWNEGNGEEESKAKKKGRKHKRGIKTKTQDAGGQRNAIRNKEEGKENDKSKKRKVIKKEKQKGHNTALQHVYSLTLCRYKSANAGERLYTK